MGNFTEDIKNEIISGKFTDRGAKIALLSAFLRTSGSIIIRGDRAGFELITENERTAEFIIDILEGDFKEQVTVSEAKFDLLSGKDKLCFECISDTTGKLLYDLGILSGKSSFPNFGIEERVIAKKSGKIAYFAGAFLGGGSCTLPDEDPLSRTGYHFEIVFPSRFAASDFCDLLCEFEIIAKLVMRKDSAVVYIKSKEAISDALDVLSCEKCIDKLNRIVELKERQNNANRVNNCSVSNIDKTVTASVKQVKAIETIAETVGLATLPPPIFAVAEARLSDNNASMQELAERLKISKSCLNHRMRKILEIAGNLGAD